MPHITRTRLVTAMNPEDNVDLPIDDILRGLKRKRIDISSEEKQNSDDSENDPDYEKQNSDDSENDPNYEVYKVVNKRIARVHLEKISFPNKMLQQKEAEKELNSYKETVETKGAKDHASSYEEMIERKRAERMAALKSMGIDKIKADFSEVLSSINKRKPRKLRVVKSFKKHNSEEVVPIRRSKRLAKIDVDLSEASLIAKSGKSIYSPEGVIFIPPELSFKDALTSDNSYEEYVSDFNIQEEKPGEKVISYDRDVLKNLSLTEFNVCKVVPARVTALSWYPSIENLIVAAGDKYGNFGLWNIQDVEKTPYLFRNHSKGITNMQFNLSNPVELISSSYDGTLRCCDLIKHMFTEIYTGETCCTYFDFVHPTTYLVSQMNGKVALVDRRTKGKIGEKKHTCHDYSIRSISVHPVNKNFFVTADNKKFVRIWDLRKLQTTPVVEIGQHERCINSAYFSPVTGNSILTTSLDDTICIFDSTHLTQDMELKSIMKHNNNTGRWLSKFKATWLPNSDDVFAVGSMDTQRKIEIFYKDMNIYYTVVRDHLTTITSLHQFHPFRSAIAAANSSGKLFIFT